MEAKYKNTLEPIPEQPEIESELLSISKTSIDTPVDNPNILLIAKKTDKP